VAHFGGDAVFAPLLSAAADFRDRVTLLELFHIFGMTASDDGIWTFPPGPIRDRVKVQCALIRELDPGGMDDEHRS
jgi:hypothetical protein